MDLEIRYENGSMTVHLEEFLNIRSIAKVRKLLKLIRSSFTPECEQQIKEFVQDGRFGCADCYNTFGLLINNSIKKIQGNNSHTGKKPRFLGDKKIHADMVADAKKRQSLQEQLEICQAKQKEAVLEEDYEKAAYYRDEIKKIKERIQAGDEVV